MQKEFWCRNLLVNGHMEETGDNGRITLRLGTWTVRIEG
jgi:hypothetical protein